MSAVAEPAPRRRRSRREIARRVALNLTGLLVFVLMAFPVYWMVATAFKPGIDVLSYEPQWFPARPTLANFSDAVGRPHFWDNVKNSLIVVGCVVVASLLLAFLAALALARYRFYGKKAFVVVIFAVQMVPLVALIIPLFIALSTVGQVNKLTGVIVTYIALVLPFCVWTLRGFVAGVPKELEEAAMVDGSSRAGAFVRIMLPLIAPGLVATSIFAFIQAWNEFIVAYVLLSSQDKQTLTIWLASFTTSRGTDWGSLMAAATLTAIPVVVFFMLVHRRVAFGLTAGAVKS